METKSLNIVIIGPPYSGVTVQQEMLKELYSKKPSLNVWVLDMKEVIKEMSNGHHLTHEAPLLDFQEDYLDDDMDKIIERGEQLDYTFVEGVVRTILQTQKIDHDLSLVRVFDGFPQMEYHAEWLVEFLKMRNQRIDVLIYLELPIEESRKRWRQVENEPSQEEYFSVRWKEFEEKTLPVIAWAKNEKLNVITVNALQSKGEVFQDILMAIISNAER